MAEVTVFDMGADCIGVEEKDGYIFFADLMADLHHARMIGDGTILQVRSVSFSQQTIDRVAEFCW